MFTSYYLWDSSCHVIIMYLLHKKEIIKLRSNTEKKGMTIIPLSIYLKGSWIKLKIGIGKGKKLHDKRQADKQKSIKKEINSALKR